MALTTKNPQVPRVHNQLEDDVPIAKAGFQKAGYASGLRSLRLTQITQILLVILGLIAFSYFARTLLLPILIAGVASTALKPVINWLRKYHLPTALASALVVGAIVVAAASGTYYLGRPAVAWIKSSPKVVANLKSKYENNLRPFLSQSDFPTGLPATNADQIGQTTSAPLPAASISHDHIASVVFNWTGSTLVGTGETIALLLLLLASGDLFLEKLVQLIPASQDKRHAKHMSLEIQKSISRYLLSISLINIGLGTVIGFTLYLLGMPSAWMWGAIAAMVNFVPYFGPVLGMIGVALAGLLAYNSLGHGLVPAGIYLGVHLLEANLLTPCILGRRFTLNPVIIFITLMFCVWLWGIIGAFLAVPLLVIFKVICGHVKVIAPLGELLSN
jgi:predicted PurR-regulated permease PerM